MLHVTKDFNSNLFLQIIYIATLEPTTHTEKEMEDKQRELGGKEKEDEHAKMEIWKYVFGFVEIAVVKCAIELGIADAIESHGSPMTLQELS